MAEINERRDPSKLIDIQRGINDQVSGYRDQIIDYKAQPDISELRYDPFEWLKSAGSRFRKPLLEAFVLQPDAANLLRDGIRFLAFSSYAGITPTWRLLARIEQSNRPEEEYLRDAAMGIIPLSPSGSEVKFANSGFEGGVKIVNAMHRMGVKVLGDDIRFDRLGKIRQIAFEMGKSQVTTEEYDFYSDITTTGNYARNSTTNDNDIGANTLTSTFNVLNLDTALTTIATAKDRISRNYLGYSADTIIIGPRMEYAVKQLLLSNDLQRAADTGAAEVRGMGTYNPYRGLLGKIIVSPWFGSSYQWALCDSRAYSYVWQQVEPWQIMQEGMNETSESWLTIDAIRYVIRGYYGHGFVDDRAWFFSNSTTAPTVA